ncbi:MAG: AraC family transcriptional regulator [Clostridia bacterium]|nr:AraC family transcriptional regulator [Clostridia bacterium]
MKLRDLSAYLQLEPIQVSDDARDVVGAYTGDLLSWVMTRLEADFAWVTIMNNVNVIAVAALADASCVIFSENAEISADVIEKAKAQNINLYRTVKSSFEISYMIGKVLYAE